MYLIIGLGNPGNRYRSTRHNIGFAVIEELARKLEIELKHKTFDACWGKGKIGGSGVILGMPQTYMNLSGHAVQKLLAYFKADIGDLIVVHDDLDLPLGKMRIKRGGGNAGHNGLGSIEEQLGSSEFIRIRLGIGKPVHKSRTEGYVLEAFRAEEVPLLPEIITAAADAVTEVVLSDVQTAMGKYNKKALVIL